MGQDLQIGVLAHRRRQQLSRSIEGALMTMKVEHRAVIVLRHFLDCSYEDMAEILELPEKTVKSRLFTARQLLKDLLQQRGAFPT